MKSLQAKIKRFLIRLQWFSSYERDGFATLKCYTHISRNGKANIVNSYGTFILKVYIGDDKRGWSMYSEVSRDLYSLMERGVRLLS